MNSWFGGQESGIEAVALPRGAMTRSAIAEIVFPGLSCYIGSRVVERAQNVFSPTKILILAARLLPLQKVVRDQLDGLIAQRQFWHDAVRISRTRAFDDVIYLLRRKA